MRAAAPTASGRPRRTGVYLGAYAWLEDLRPSPRAADPGASCRRDLRAASAAARRSCATRATAATSTRRRSPRRGRPPCCAAAISPTRRRRTARRWRSTCRRTACGWRSSLLEGIRNGQSLGALLGYRFERGLHDDHGLAEVDKFIYPLRKAFPLGGRRAGADRRPTPDVPIEAIEARNVLDGRKLVDADPARRGSATYPFGRRRPAAATTRRRRRRSTPRPTRCSTSTTRSPTSRSPKACTRRCREISTASPRTLDAYTTGNFPPEPEVVQTPPAGIGADPPRRACTSSPGLPAPAGATPRAQRRAGARRVARRHAAAARPRSAARVAWTDPVGGAPAGAAGDAGRPRPAADRRAAPRQARRACRR